MCVYIIDIFYTKTDILKFEGLQLQICRQIQGFPNRTANAAVYILRGLEPIQAAGADPRAGAPGAPPP